MRNRIAWTRQDFLSIGTVVAGTILMNLSILSAGRSLAQAQGGGPPAVDSALEKFKELQTQLLAKYGTQATSRYFSLQEPALKVHLLEAGQGEPVLFIHGGNSVAVALEPLLSLLQPHFHLFAPDRPGCGLTDKLNYRGIPFRNHAVTFVKSVMDELGLSKAALVGNSMGGYWSLVFALAYPERVSKLILIGEPAGSDTRPRLFHWLLGRRGVNTLLYATILKPSLEGTREAFRRALVANVDRVPPEFLETAYAAAMLPGAQESWLTMLEEVVPLWGPAYLTYALRPELPKLRPPTLFIWGDKDAFGSPSLGEEMCKLIPNARIEVLHNAGHLPWLDEPERSAELIINFLK